MPQLFSQKQNDAQKYYKNPMQLFVECEHTESQLLPVKQR